MQNNIGCVGGKAVSIAAIQDNRDQLAGYPRKCERLLCNKLLGTGNIHMNQMLFF